MNDLMIFNSNEFGQVRTLEIEGKIYFVGKDVASALDYKEPHKAITRHCKGGIKHPIPTKGGKQEMLVIPEGDVYRLIVHSKLPNAEKFESWVFDEVLPQIRKTGGYISTNENMTDEEIMAKALLVAQKTIENKNKLIENQNKRIEKMKPKEIFADAVASSKDTILIRQLAKILKQNGIDMGEKRLYKWLRDNGYLIKQKGADYNTPTQRAMDLKLFEVKETSVTHSNGSVIISKTTKVTGKGQIYFINKFKEVK